MEIVCNIDKLKESLGYTERVVTRHLTLPILNNVLIKSDKNGIRISSTNLEIGVNSWFPCKVVQAGEITVPAKIFHSIISSLISDKANLEVKGDNILNIVSEGYKASLKGESAKDFPIIPKLNNDLVISLNSNIICKALSQLVGFVSNSETRPEITGVLLYKNSGEKFLTAVATDSFRLGEKKIELKEEYIDVVFSVIVPSKTITEVVRVFSDKTEDLNIIFEKNQIGFELNKTEIVSRLIEGNYPDYKRLIPSEFNTVVKLDKDRFSKLIKLVGLFSSKVNDIKLSFVKEEGPRLVIYAGDSDLGENDSEFKIDMSGEALEVKFNWRYLIDGVSNITGNTAVFNFIDEQKPCLVKSLEDASFLYIVMPIRA
ncbi:MAG: DNA polymerase III subunit beta [bacterium]|nr:DNA polymerase III subunit beta [bacterium]